MGHISVVPSRICENTHPSEKKNNIRTRGQIKDRDHHLESPNESVTRADPILRKRIDSTRVSAW